MSLIQDWLEEEDESKGSPVPTETLRILLVLNLFVKSRLDHADIYLYR
jgi:hypothetical protein